jgi:hypothetical protein
MFAEILVALALLLQDSDHLSSVKARLRDASARHAVDPSDARLRTALAVLEEEAAEALRMKPVSVMDKGVTPPSGDKHDYLSQAPYWWPDASKPKGLPYIRRDGERNPEINRITDHGHFDRLMDAVATLGLAFQLTGKPAYAEHAARLVRVWFLDPATRMTPHLRYGQGIPGVNEGRGIGIIETRRLPKMLDGVLLIAGSGQWRPDEEAALQAWMRSYLTWLLESQHGKEESKNGNNHETWYDVQAAGLALYTGQGALARRVLEGSRDRIARQIQPDGRQPRELERTRGWHYSIFNLEAFFDLATLGDRVGVDLWRYRTADGRSLRAAVDFLVPYGLQERQWPYKEITGFTGAELHTLLRRAAVAWNEPKYNDIAARVGGGSPWIDLVLPRPPANRAVRSAR